METSPSQTLDNAREGQSGQRGGVAAGEVEHDDRPVGRVSQGLVDGALSHGLRVRCPTDAERRTSIVTIVHPDPHRAVDALRARGVIVDSRPGVVRFSPHFFNTADEIDAAVAAMVEVSAARV